jgi:hypothetical protein
MRISSLLRRVAGRLAQLRSGILAALTRLVMSGWYSRLSGDLDAWLDSVAPLGTAVCGVYNTKAFEYVELAKSYLKYSVSVSGSCWILDIFS